MFGVWSESGGEVAIGKSMKDKRKPIRVIPNNGKHKTETRVFANELHETYCVQPRCKFRGKHAQQGVCHTTTTFDGGRDWSYVEKVIKSGDEFVAGLKGNCKPYSDKKYISELESYAACIWSNNMFGLDELISLRREVALLRLKTSGKKAKK